MKLTTEDLDYLRKLLRSYLKDFSEFNTLIGGEEFSPPQLDLAIQLALDKIEKTPPIIRISWRDLPLTLILQAATIELLDLQRKVDIRNKISYQDQGLQIVDTHDQEYSALVNEYYQKFFKELGAWKTEKNIESALDPIYSI